MAHDDDDQGLNGATETSPLLQKTDIAAIESAGGVAANGTAETAVPDGSEIERQPSNEDRQKQYEGMPEVKKKLPIIMPALAIGVSS
jgi:hypothetical protein